MGVMGISTDFAKVKNIDCCHDGLYIMNVDKASAAGLSGLMVGDIVYKINNTKINDFLDLRMFIYSSNIGDKITLHLYRSGTPLTLQLVLGER